LGRQCRVLGRQFQNALDGAPGQRRIDAAADLAQAQVAVVEAKLENLGCLLRCGYPPWPAGTSRLLRCFEKSREIRFEISRDSGSELECGCQLAESFAGVLA
jgi:hypothetical protein